MKTMALRSARNRSSALTLCAVAISAAAVAAPVGAQSNLGAIPAYQAIAKAKEEVSGDQDGKAIFMWADSSIHPLSKGWCVVLKGFENSAKVHKIPVYVEQDGEHAWRNDALGKAKYDGGADGLYEPPYVADKCRISDAVPRSRTH